MNNTLYYGDNLDVLKNKLKDETVDLCYIDPPFNSKRNYFQIYNNIGKEDAAQAQAFIDTWTWNELAAMGFNEIMLNPQGRYTRQTIELIKGFKAVLGDNGLLVYLISMTQRVNEIQRVLKPTGSFYLHCDPTASHYLKLILDGIFCGKGGDFRNEVIWHYRRWTNVSERFKKMHDVILCYSKSNQVIFNKIEVDPTESQKTVIEKGYNVNKVNSAKGKILQLLVYDRKKVDALISSGKLNIEKYGNVVYRDTQLTEASDVWEIQYLHSQAAERLGYPTQKPEALLERIILASSNEGDVILDAYCGCGTTVAVAQRLKRNWIGIDITYQSISVILKRLEDSFGAEIVDSIRLDGIPKDMDSARALAHKKDDRLRKEFEKWVVLTYSNNRAAIHEKKGADKGIDGVAYFFTGLDTTGRVIFQVKSGGVKRNDISTLNSDRIREQAELAVLLTLEESTKPMRDEALAAGFYSHPLLARDIPRIQIITIQEMIEEGKRLDLPLGVDVLKSAASVNTTIQNPLTLE